MLNFMVKSPSMFNNSKSSAHRSTIAPCNRSPSIAPCNPITSDTSIPMMYPMSPILGSCLYFQNRGSWKYACSSCDKAFPTTQALGGHQNAHRKERNDLRVNEVARAAQENRRFRPYVFQHDPWRWAPPSIYNDFINKTKPRMRSYDFYHFLGMAGDCNPKWGAGLGFGSGSKRKKRGYDDNDDAGADRDKKKGKYVGVIDDLKVSMSNVTLSLATGSGDVDKSDSGLDWEDGECMYVVGGDGEASTSKTEELDLNLKL
ncbi:hypothetical protein C1H46_015335 [Malus baccata]|uniref:C2H2-type domain-containing protein n=1 Tax=Malus baccata TaxID=106549 RepID=A0A540MJV6_MALBA|nr:hypothetical protein C1H46_015335 [Malus baccata]